MFSKGNKVFSFVSLLDSRSIQLSKARGEEIVGGKGF
jgi:hypothetical protein